MIKKIIVSLIATLALSMSAFAVDFSVGVTAGGWGPTFGRGSHYKNMISDNPGTGMGMKKGSIKYSQSFAPVAQVVGQVDIIPFFGIELGIGYAMKSIGFTRDFDDTASGGKKGTYQLKYSFDQLSIPILLKGQYEIADVVNIYVGVGPKFNFNLGAKKTYYTDNKENKKPDDWNDDVSGKFSNPTKFDKKAYNVFDMDLSFALGAEYKIAGAHYIGLRVGYDMNLLGTMKKDKSYEDDTTGENISKYEGREKLFVDDLAISLTYRYKFGS